MKQFSFYKILSIVLLSLVFACTNDKKDEHSDHNEQKEQDTFTCPMHPEIIRNAPGSCPICGMDLIKKESDAKAVHGVELESLLKPANEFVIAAIPVIALEQREEDVELNVVGTVAYDTRQAGAISSRVKGRIEKLYIRYKYQPVRKGQKVMEIYSPELMTAQQNLIFLLENDPHNSSMINAAKDRLILLGMSSTQVAQVMRTKVAMYSVPVFSNYTGFVTDINASTNTTTDVMLSRAATNRELNIKEGMYFESGQAVFTIYNPSSAWILLDIFPEQQSLVKVGNPVRIVPETAPHRNFRGRIDYMEPVFRPGSKTLNARVYYNNATLRLPIGSRVTAHVFSSSQNAYWLPKESVLSLGINKIVFKKETGSFRAHMITTGMELNNYIQVTSGLAVMDSVAVNAQFLVDNEAFIKVSNQ